MINQTECSGLEQRSLIKFFVDEKCKPCEIYRRMCDMYREAGFSKENVYKLLIKVAKKSYQTIPPT